ncbi:MULTISPECIES: ABC transporter ATP-binding protein [Enterococcus]|uniref:ABC transporter ATP-binding protein n=1 Tax=Enterococcus TaxID=1350 RepID=UPI00065E359D|nr:MULTISPECIES: ABC transporter ATP-binding protein [Enterococcus]KAF1300554.1 bacitracin ABC transporter ATP-binding protein [Enterococcus sp. JM9B]
MLQVKNLRKVYGTSIKYEALKGIDLTVEDGEFVGIMGPSGSGKSTLLNLLATIDNPTSGSIELNGKNPHEMNQEQIAKFRRKELGFVFQNFNLMPTLTVEENIVLPLTLDGEKVAVMQRAAQEVAQRLGISDLLKKRIPEISGGQQQRVAVARAMIHRPNLVLADEPTGNLDTKSSKDVMRLLRQLNEKEKATILMVTHDPLAASYCKRIIFIKDGGLVREIRNDDQQKNFYDRIIADLAHVEEVENEF